MISNTARARAALLSIVIASVITAGCGLLPGGTRSASVSRHSFGVRLTEREKITDAQARCVSRYVYAGYQADAIRVIYDKGLTSLPSGMWGEYAHAMVGCVFHDQLQLVPRNKRSSTGP